MDGRGIEAVLSLRGSSLSSSPRYFLMKSLSLPPINTDRSELGRRKLRRLWGEWNSVGGEEEEKKKIKKLLRPEKLRDKSG